MDPFEQKTPAEIGEEIEFALENWPDNCHVVTRRMLTHGLVPGGIQVRGQAAFAPQPDTNWHCWIRRPDGLVVDPLRYHYENAGEPQIYLGPEGPEYQEQPKSSEPSSLERLLGRDMRANLHLIRDSVAAPRSSAGQ